MGPVRGLDYKIGCNKMIPQLVPFDTPLGVSRRVWVLGFVGSDEPESAVYYSSEPLIAVRLVLKWGVVTMSSKGRARSVKGTMSGS